MTEHICQATSFRAVWKLLTTWVENNPPGYFVCARAATALFGPGPASLRRPSLLGVLVFIGSTYVLLVRRYPVVNARLGAAVCALPPVLDYACEARPYGLWLGLCGLMLLCWQSATEAGGRWRRVALAGLGITTALAVSTHYFTVLVVAVLTGAELVRSVARRRIDPWVFIALGAGVCPLWLYRPIMANAQAFVSSSWARPMPDSVGRTYMELLMPCLPVTLVLIVGLAVSPPGSAQPGGAGSPARGMPGHELAAAVGLAALPLLGYILAIAFINHYRSRYDLPAAGGVAILLAAAFAAASGPRQILAHVGLGLAFLGLIQGLAWIAANQLDAPAGSRMTMPVAMEAASLASRWGGPLVTNNMF